jgi:CubicO group peptidase (beta-lactamase class C family)
MKKVLADCDLQTSSSEAVGFEDSSQGDIRPKIDSSEGESIATSPLDTTPENQAATYRHFDRIAPTRLIRHGASVLPLPPHHVSLSALHYDFDGHTFSIDDYMQRNRTSGLLILKGSELALERYAMGNNASTRWTSFSVAKSLTSTLVGAALQDGSIRSLDDTVAQYVPQLIGSAYGESSIRDVLRMCSGVRWIEEYTSTGDSDIARLLQASRSGEAGAVMELLRTRQRVAPTGSVFNYSTGDSHVLSAVVVAATGQHMSDYLSDKIWTPMGMEADGYWMLDEKDGLEMGGNNFSARLRDYARFGQFILGGGVINGTNVLPVGWVELAGQPDSAVTAHGKLYPDYALGYGYQWWCLPLETQANPFHDGAFIADGVFGQFIYINPAEDMVVVVWSAWPQSWVDASEQETYSLIAAAAAMLR